MCILLSEILLVILAFVRPHNQNKSYPNGINILVETIKLPDPPSGGARAIILPIIHVR
jgi:hypothetical protein